MEANNYICNLDGRLLLWAGCFKSGPLVLAVSTLVAIGPNACVVSTVPTPPGAGLATMIDGDTGDSAEAGGLVSSHQPFPTPPHGCCNITKLFFVSVI